MWHWLINTVFLNWLAATSLSGSGNPTRLATWSNMSGPRLGSGDTSRFAVWFNTSASMIASNLVISLSQNAGTTCSPIDDDYVCGTGSSTLFSLTGSSSLSSLIGSSPTCSSSESLISASDTLSKTSILSRPSSSSMSNTTPSKMSLSEAVPKKMP